MDLILYDPTLVFFFCCSHASNIWNCHGLVFLSGSFFVIIIFICFLIHLLNQLDHGCLLHPILNGFSVTRHWGVWCYDNFWCRTNCFWAFYQTFCGEFMRLLISIQDLKINSNHKIKDINSQHMFVCDRLVVNKLVKADLVIEVDDEEYLNVHGNVVDEFDETRLGNKTKFRMMHPNYLLFVNKVGPNTNAEKDNTNSERRICHRDNRSQQVSSSSNPHYTTLPFTNALGEPVYR